MAHNVLVVDDDASMRRSLARVLKGSGYSVGEADCGDAALDEVRRAAPDLVLLDVCLPDTSGLEILMRLKQINRRIVVIAMTAFATTRDAVLAMKGGAYEYLSKPFNIDAMRLLVHEALNQRSPEKPDIACPFSGSDRKACALTCPPINREARPWESERWHDNACDRIIGTGPAMKRVLSLIRRLPPNSSSHVLAEGETGTGKELVARAVHETSCRSSEPFVAISCAAIPRELIESELFGYDKGAFTNARSDGKVGIFERAGGGTVFLDEIGELQLEVQAKLLRVLEVREFHRIGGTKAVPLRARILAATNRNLKQEVEQGRFRADLYYRLNVVQITLPPLRDHREDILPLVESFMREFSARFEKCFTGISPNARELLEAYDWPGNVRELRNIIERIVLLETGDTILPEHLPPEILNVTPCRNETAAPPSKELQSTHRLEAVELHVIERALERTDWNVVKAARLLGLNRGALRYRMQKHGLKKKEGDA